MDLRSNIVTFITGAPRRIGYDFGGGAFLLTDAVPADPDKRHRVDDWMQLMSPLQSGSDSLEPFGPPPERFEPQLRVTDEERAAAAARLRECGIAADDIVVAIHGGASVPRRMWPAESFERVAEKLAAKHGAKTVFFSSPAQQTVPFPQRRPSSARRCAR